MSRGRGGLAKSNRRGQSGGPLRGRKPGSTGGIGPLPDLSRGGAARRAAARARAEAAARAAARKKEAVQKAVLPACKRGRWVGLSGEETGSLTALVRALRTKNIVEGVGRDFLTDILRALAKEKRIVLPPRMASGGRRKKRK